MKLLLTVFPFTLLSFAFGAEYLVGVGKDETTGQKGLGFDPSVIRPAVGDVIAWEFRSGQHSVVQSSFENPCTSNGGINTGVQTVADNLAVDAAGLPIIRVTINNTDPIWFFDEAGGLCSQGAVFAVNPSATQTAAAFKDNASKAQTAPSSTTSASTTAASGSTTTAASGSVTSTSPSPTPTKNSAIKAVKDIGQYVVLAMGAMSVPLFGIF